MKSKTLLAGAILLSALQSIDAAPARRILPPKMGADELASYLPDKASVEVRLDTDVTGDGIKDVIAVGAAEEERKLVVLAGYSTQTDVGYGPVGQAQLDVSPLGSVSLKVEKGILLVGDLTGGTTAVSSLYRYRYEPATKRMRLIGDDVELYSRTYAHDGLAISTNRLTGIQIVTRNRLASGKHSDAAYLPGKPVTKKVSRAPVFMEEAPSPAKTLGMED